MSQTDNDIRESGTQCPWCHARYVKVRDGIFLCHRCSYKCDVSEPPPITVIGWTNAKDTDFIDHDCTSSEIYQAIVREIKEKGYSFGWGAHQSGELPCTPVINNGFKISCGPRTWGWIMAEAHGADESDGSAYVEYSLCISEDPIYPQKHVDYEKIIPFDVE